MKNFTLMILNLFIRTIALNVTLYYASAFSTSYGKQYIAAYTIAINLWFLGAFIVDGYSSAGNILSGKLYGQRDFKSLVELFLSNLLIKDLSDIFDLENKTVEIKFNSQKISSLIEISNRYYINDGKVG